MLNAKNEIIASQKLNEKIKSINQFPACVSLLFNAEMINFAVEREPPKMHANE